jgi:uncharacterized protein (DUF1800 family)
MPQRREGSELEGLLTQGMGRRAFLARAGVLGLSAASLPALLAACAPVEEASVSTATPSPFPTPTPFATPTATARPTPTPVPTATPTPTPTATPMPTPLPPEPSPLATEAERVGHLLRRAGFGAAPAELARYQAMGVEGAVDALLDYESADDGALDALLTAQELDLTRLRHLQRWWLLRMVHGQRPLQERMTLFWHGLLTSEYGKVSDGELMLAQNQLYRSHALGRFDELLKAVSRDPAMLIYLDSRTNRKEAPNENYSRELMELFSLGVGNYTETDVRELSRAYTGWGLFRREYRFNVADHDQTTKTLLGETGNIDGDDGVDIILRQQAAARFISTRLFSFFAYPDPEPAVVDRLAAVFTANGTLIRPVVREILTSEEFYSSRALAATVRAPADLVACTLRSLGAQTSAQRPVVSMEAMGQALFNPPNVAGWPGGEDWVSSATVLERVNFANAVASGRRAELRYDPLALMAQGGAETPEAQVDLLASLLRGHLPRWEREVLVSFATTAPVDSEQRLRDITYLLAASSGHQLT